MDPASYKNNISELVGFYLSARLDYLLHNLLCYCFSWPRPSVVGTCVLVNLCNSAPPGCCVLFPNQSNLNSHALLLS